MTTQGKVITASILLLMGAGLLIFWRTQGGKPVASLFPGGSGRSQQLEAVEVMSVLPQGFPVNSEQTISSTRREVAGYPDELFLSYFAKDLLEPSYAAFLNYFETANWTVTAQKLEAAGGHLSAYNNDLVVSVSLFQRTGSSRVEVEVTLSQRKK